MRIADRAEAQGFKNIVDHDPHAPIQRSIAHVPGAHALRHSSTRRGASFCCLQSLSISRSPAL